MPAKFIVSKDKSGGYRFTLTAPSGQLMASSPGYATKAAALSAVASIRRNAAGAALIDSVAAELAKPRAAKSSVAKKAVVKKTAVKKADVKKAAVKKAAVKKTDVKKAVVKKAAVKKAVVKKAAVKSSSVKAIPTPRTASGAAVKSAKTKARIS